MGLAQARPNEHCGGMPFDQCGACSGSSQPISIVIMSRKQLHEIYTSLTIFLPFSFPSPLLSLPLPPVSPFGHFPSAQEQKFIVKTTAGTIFHKHVQEMHSNSDAGFKMEYQVSMNNAHTHTQHRSYTCITILQSIPMKFPNMTYSAGQLECNKQKNRFVNIFPCKINTIITLIMIFFSLIISFLPFSFRWS